MADTETVLLVAQIVFLALLLLFVLVVMRSSARQLDAPVSPARRPAAPDDSGTDPFHRAVAALPPAAPAPLPTARGPVPHIEPPAPQGPPAEPDPRPSAGSLDITEHLDPHLVVVRSPTLAPGLVVSLEGGLTIGRSGASGLPVGDSFVSHMHARIVRRGAYYVVEDLGSTNGTFLNDRRVDGDAQLKMRDLLRLGETVFRYEE